MSSETGRADAAFCADLVRTRDFRTYAASLFVPPEARRAWIAYEAGDVKTAREQMTRGLSLDPDQPQLRELRDRIGGGAGASR